MPSCAFAYWRSFSAEDIDTTIVRELDGALSGLTAILPGVRCAVRGDAAAAIIFALKMRNSRLDGMVDLAMSALARCALTDAGAAAVLSHCIAVIPRRMRRRRKLAASWNDLHCSKRGNPTSSEVGR